MTILVISLTPKGGIASTRPGIMCSEIGTILPCLRNDPYTPSEILTMHGVTRKERSNKSDPVDELSGPVMHDTLPNICKDCILYIKNG